MDNVALLLFAGVLGFAIGLAVGIAVASLRPPRKAKPAAVRPRPARPSVVPVASPEPAEPVVPVAQASEAAVAPPEPVVSTPFYSQLTAKDVPIATPPAQRPTISPVNVLARALQGDVKPPQPVAKSIAAQVDEILQEMLEASPLGSNAIRLLELPGKGLVVMVGLDQYEGVDAVPDVDIRNLIRAAVAEWERRVSE